MITTKLTTDSVLPLTCSRAGVCCHGNVVMLNPWEIFKFSQEKNISPREFRDQHCDLGGIRLKFDGKPNVKGKHSCGQYVENFGCSVHAGRPLACRLYPIGRQIQSDVAHYIHQGTEFPCLNGCAEVLDLPKLSVGEYLKGQQAEPYEKAQDAYLSIMQNIADIGFELLLDSGLAASGNTKTLRQWRELGNLSPEDLAKRIGPQWLDALMIPEISEEAENPMLFAQQHNELLLQKAQEKFGALETLEQAHEASVLMIGVALMLTAALGADTTGISEFWIETALSHGAQM